MAFSAFCLYTPPMSYLRQMNHIGKTLFVVLIAFLVGCADTDSFVDMDAATDGRIDHGSSDGWVDLFISDASTPDGFELGKTRVYAHTADTLFEVDPDSFAITPIADFVWPDNTDITNMTDIALDEDGNMIGVTKTTVYAVDPQTAICTPLATFPTEEVHFVGLSFVVDTSATDETEYLMGLDKDGAVYQIDPTTGATTQRGSLGSGLKAGGDVVSVKGFGTVATVTPPDDDTDWLAQLDPGSGKATLIGDTGIKQVFGVGYWKGQVYGFATGGEFLLIDVTTGHSTIKETSNNAWWGAGVTTEAPVIY